MPGTPPASPAHIQYCNITLITTQHSQEGAKAEQEGATETRQYCRHSRGLATGEFYYVPVKLGG